MAIAPGTNVEAQRTEADAVTGTVTFVKPIRFLEIYNTDGTNAGIFNVNGLDIKVPASSSFSGNFGTGTPRTTVTVTGSTSYILTRYE